MDSSRPSRSIFQSSQTSASSLDNEMFPPDGAFYRVTSYRAVTLLTVVAVAILYLLVARSVAGRFIWGENLGGFYDLLGRGFLSGHLYLPVEPAPELLRLADPWNPDQNKPYRLHDAILYNRHYYLYHGAAPALLLFAPWRLVTGRDLPEPVAAFLFCSGGFLFSCLLFIDLLEHSRCRLPITLFAAMLVALGVTQSVPFLLQRVLMYEVAIASGYFFLMAGFCFFFRILTVEQGRALYAALSGVCFGLAVGCRPQMFLAAFFALLWLMYRKLHREGLKGLVAPEAISFVIPLALIGTVIASYNYARFGSPLEFGLRYQVGALWHPTGLPHVEAFLPGLYYLTVCPPYFERIFPFFRLAARSPFGVAGYKLPPGYLLEPVAGFIALCPLTLIAIASPFLLCRPGLAGTVRTMVWLLVLTAASCMLFIAGTGWASQRWDVDFLPVLVLIGCYVAGAVYIRLIGWKRKAGAAAIALAVAYSAAANIALAIQGPYDSFVQFRPSSYVKIARLFSPSDDLRPLLNPRVSVEATVEFPVSPPGGPEPLVSLGEFGSLYTVKVGKVSENKVRLTSTTFARKRSPTQDNERMVDVDVAPGPNRIRLEFAPETLVMTVLWNGKVVLTNQLSSLVTARAQLKFGEDNIPGSNSRFSGRVVPVRQIIGPAF